MGKLAPSTGSFNRILPSRKWFVCFRGKFVIIFFFFFPFSTISPAFCSFSSIRKETKTFSRILVLFFCDVSVMYERFTMRAL